MQYAFYDVFLIAKKLLSIEKEAPQDGTAADREHAASKPSLSQTCKCQNKFLKKVLTYKCYRCIYNI